MDEAINDIIEYVKRRAAGFSLLDQAQIFEELSSRMSDMNADALKDEYLADGLYC